MDRCKRTIRLFGSGLAVLSLVASVIVVLAAHTPSLAATAKVLRFATTAAAIDCGSAGLDGWMIEVEKRTQGAVKFEKFWAGSLVPGPNILDGIDSGVADVGQLILSYFMSKLPLHTVAVVPGMELNSAWARGQAFMQLYDRVPQLRTELGKYHGIPLAIRGSAGLNLISKKPIRRLADIKGMKIRSTGYAQNMVAELGAVPVGLAWSEIYTGFERGTIDGSMQDLSGMTGLNLQDLGKYLTMFNLPDTAIVIAIRKEVFDGLPEKVKKVMLDMAQEEGTTTIMRSYFTCPKSVETFDLKTGIWRRAGVEVVNLSPDDQSLIKTAGAKVRGQWIAEMSAKGFESEKIHNAFVELCAKWEKKTPKDLQGK